MINDLKERFRKARSEYIESHFMKLNDMQREAVMTTEGPLLLLAGAGSGKTTVLINRIANLIRFGCGSDTEWIPDKLTLEDVEFLENLPPDYSERERLRADRLCAVRPTAPWSIIAITFTNKAANELKERLQTMVGPQANDVWAMTFHSACCRILRQNISRLGYSSRFTIYDSADSEKLMKSVLDDLGLDTKTFSAKYVLAAISIEKQQFLTPEDMLDDAEGSNNYKAVHIARAYERYQKKLKDNNALDFDDIIFLTVRLLQEHEDVRLHYQNLFRYVLVDEYQDTNHLQYLLTKLLADKRKNICVVGDDDQSIYRFRGATIENILNFEKHYPNCRTIRLEQNYRSTQCILDAANAVIANNRGRKGKRLWTENPKGTPVTVFGAYDHMSEANYIANQIINRPPECGYKDFAILYRTNAQSNALEQVLRGKRIPYRVIGGMRFFERAEIKDILAYMHLINNRMDDLRLRRIINVPPRGIGAKTVDAAQRLAEAESVPMYSIISTAHLYGPLEKNARKLREFTSLIEDLALKLQYGMSLTDFYDELLLRSGYASMLEWKDTEESKSRLDNVKELKSSIQNYINESLSPSLAGFLEEISLYTDIEEYNHNDDAVVLMTMHAAKGLEFPHVFISGFEDGLFPGMRAIGNDAEMEEERRLCYVAITRAKQTLTITHSKQRMLYGRTSAALASRFLKEIPEGCIATPERPPVKKDATYAIDVKWDINKGPACISSRIRHPKTSNYSLREAAASLQNSIEPKPCPEYHPGDRVVHKSFGEGMVLTVLPMGNDALLEVAFDTVGTKKLMAKTASVYMEKLS